MIALLTLLILSFSDNVRPLRRNIFTLKMGKAKSNGYNNEWYKTFWFYSTEKKNAVLMIQDILIWHDRFTTMSVKRWEIRELKNTFSKDASRLKLYGPCDCGQNIFCLFPSSFFHLLNFLRLSKILLPDIVCRSSLPPCWCRSRARWCRPRRSSRPPSPSPPSSGTPRLARLSRARQQLHAARACTGAGAVERVSYLSW